MPTLQVTLHSARNLSSGGILGSYEHYAIIAVGQQTQRSGFSRSRADPVWDETFQFFVNPNDVLWNQLEIEKIEKKGVYRPTKNTYHNMVKTEQNKWLQENVPNLDGLCLVLDGKQGGSSQALVEIGFPSERIIAVSSSGDAGELYRFKKMRGNEHLEKLHVVQRKLTDVLDVMSGPCLSVAYFDYMGYWTGNKQKRCNPENEVSQFFSKGLPLPHGCFLMITISDPARAKMQLEDHKARAILHVTQQGIKFQYEVKLVFSREFRTNRMKMLSLGFLVKKKEVAHQCQHHHSGMNAPSVYKTCLNLKQNHKEVTHWCQGRTKKNQRCKNKTKGSLFCHLHKSQGQ